MNHLKLVSALSLGILLSSAAEAQVMKSQVYQQFMKAQVLQRRGQDSAAIASLNEVATLVPAFPPTYLRQAEIYDSMYKRDGSAESLQAAVFMYRKYLTLEFNERLIKEPSARLRALEDLLKVAHFEDEEMNDEKEGTEAEEIFIVTDKESATLLASQSKPAPVKAEIELKSLISVPTVDPKPTINESILAATAGTGKTGNGKESKEIPALAEEKKTISPILGKPIFSYLSLYHTDIPLTPITQGEPIPALTTQSLTGRWVSESTQESGREQWIFDIKPYGQDKCEVIFSRNSGITNEDEDKSTTFRRIMLGTKNYLQKAKLLSDTNYDIINERVIGTLTPEGFTFSFDVDKHYESNSRMFKWTKNLINNLAGLLPFGYNISTYVSNYVDRREAIARTKSATISYTFNCKYRAAGILSCYISNTSSSFDINGRMKTKVGVSSTTSFYKTEQGYTFAQDIRQYSSKEIGNWEALFEKVKADAEEDMNYNYPLAYLYYYGVGTKQDIGKAIECMSTLAMQPNDTRAKTWLSTYFYHKAYTDQTKNIILRRKYIKSAQYWCDQMHEAKQKEWYGVKGDMCSSDQSRELFNAMQDSAMYYYNLGNEAGDVYSTYRLGCMYLNSEKQNIEEAQRLLSQAAEKGNENALVELARIALLKKDYEAYLKNLRLAADLGCPDAFNEIGEAFCAGPSQGCKLDPKEGMQMKRLSVRAEKDNWIPVILSFGYSIDSYLL